MIGQTIGKYRIVGQLGRGGMGTVYKAVDETLDREVAIKVLNPELADSNIIERFRAEATTLARLHHPEIATIYELFRSETELLIVMERVRGETLERISVRLGPLVSDRAAYLVDKILSALEHAHRAGIVHCDMKPANGPPPVYATNCTRPLKVSATARTELREGTDGRTATNCTPSYVVSGFSRTR